MSLKDDIDDLGKVWSSSGSLFKVMAVISVFLSISSIASLSDRIFEWKGFVLDGVNFYRLYISVPASKMLASISIVLNQTKMDYLIVVAISMSCFARGGIMLGNDKLRQDETFQSNYHGIASVLASLYVVVLVAMRLNAETWELKYHLLIVYIGAPIILFFFIFDRSLKNLYSYFFPVIWAIVVVLLLGAINVGLTK